MQNEDCCSKFIAIHSGESRIYPRRGANPPGNLDLTPPLDLPMIQLIITEETTLFRLISHNFTQIDVIVYT